MSRNPFDRPVVIVGAGRSGTTMLKDALGAHPDLFATEFELNHVWRTGNAGVPHDQLTPEAHYTPSKAEHIRREFHALLAASGKPRLVEKTAASVMRLRYIHAVLPEARIVHILRDGRAVVASAMQRWQAGSSTAYMLRKSRTVPLRDLPRVGLRHLGSLVASRFGNRTRRKSWGPRWPGMDAEITGLSLAEIGARQWQESVRAAAAQKAALPLGCYLEVRYEDIVTAPEAMFDRIARFVEVDGQVAAFLSHIRDKTHDQGLHKWRHSLSAEDQAKIAAIIAPTLRENGYDA